ncbi:class II aldolase/adducin family protein [Cellulomonas hominis]
MTTSSSSAAVRVAVAATARRLAAAGLLPGTSGNLSARAGDLVAVTATGAVLADATPDLVTVVTLDGTPVEGDLAPTSELELHLGVYRATGLGAVVHTHAPMATALSLVLDELPVVHYQQLVLGGAVRVAPFAVFGSAELAAGVHTALDGRLAALMANHGAVALGADLAAAASNALLLEWLCSLYWHARALGVPRELSPDEQRAVVEVATRTGYGTTRRLG